MKKELLFMFAAAALGTVCFSSITADKVSAKTSGDYQYVVTGKKQKTCAIRKYKGKDTDVVVPEKLDGYVVTRIGNQAFKNKKNIKSVKLSRYITIIGEKSFSGCSGLESISMPQKVHTIKKSAFSSCGSLNSIKLPAKLKTLGSKAFYNCPIRELNIPQYLETIPGNAFNSNFNKITVDKDNKIFDSRDNCNALINTSTNTLIKGTNTTVIPDGIKSIDDYAFSYCSTLKEITIPASVKRIGNNAFYYCTQLGKINFSEGLTTIGDDAFNKCSSLKEIDLPDSVETIGTKAFFACDKVESIYIPKNLKKTDFSKVFDCPSASKLTVSEGNKIYDSRDNCNAVIETASNTIVFAISNSSIPEGVTTIKKKAFKNLDDLEEITIPSSVTKIDDYAFAGCSDLGVVNLSEGLVEIGSYAFFECSSLENIKLPDSLETIGNSAFFECDNITEIYIPKNLQKTDISAVFECSNAQKITVSKENKYYDSRNNCNAVIESDTDTLVLGCEGSVIPGSVKVIGEASFMGAPARIVIPEGVEKISAYAFNDQDNLETITLPVSLTEIGVEALGTTVKTINYRGSKAQWNNIEVYESDLQDIEINYDYKG